MLCVASAIRVRAVSPAPSTTDAAPTIVVRGATLIDGKGGPPVADSVVTVRGDRIARVGDSKSVAVPRSARVIDGRGRFLIPGLIDCHCHMEDIGLGDLAELPPEWEKPEKARELVRINARLDLLSGITTVRDLGSTDLVFRVREEIDSGRIPGPRILAAGRQLVKRAPDAHGAPTFVEYDGPEEGRARVREQIAKGADVIKLRLAPDRPLPSTDELAAIVDEAHRRGRRVAVHTWVPADEAVRLAIHAGVDSIEHNAPLRAKDESVLREMARRHIALMAGAGSFYVQRWEPPPAGLLGPHARPLFPAEIAGLFSGVSERLRAQTDEMKSRGWNPAQVQARFAAEMKNAREAGVLVVFGTDCGGELMIHGQQYRALYGETRMGSTPMEALLMATRDAARALGKEADLGTIEPGKLADLVLVGADPLADFRNLARITAVIQGGRVYSPSDTERDRTGAR